MGHGFCDLRVCDHPACGHTYVRVSDELARHGTTGGGRVSEPLRCPCCLSSWVERPGLRCGTIEGIVGERDAHDSGGVGGRPSAGGSERTASSPSSTAGDSRAGEQPPPAPPIQPHTSDRGEAVYCELAVKEMRQARERVEEAVAAAEAKQRERQPPAAEPQECSGLLILTELHAIGYVGGEPMIGPPGKMQAPTEHDLAIMLRHQRRLAAELSDLHGWTLEAMQRFPREEGE